MTACPGAFGAATGGFRPLKRLIMGPKLLKIRLFTSPLSFKIVSENELSSSSNDSAVFLLNSGYRKRTIDRQKRARNDTRMRLLIALMDVNLAGLQSMPCVRSRLVIK